MTYNVAQLSTPRDFYDVITHDVTVTCRAIALATEPYLEIQLSAHWVHITIIWLVCDVHLMCHHGGNTLLVLELTT